MTTPEHINEPMPADSDIPPGANAELRGSLHAIRRAALRARQLAQQTGTDLIVVRSGQLVRVPPQSKISP